MNIERIRAIASCHSTASDAIRSGILYALGSGSFGSAFQLKDGTVLKTGDVVDGTALWIMHAAKVYRDTGKPALYAPRVYAFEVLESGRWWARMEWVTSAKQKTGLGAWGCEAPRWMQMHLREWGDELGLKTWEGDYSYPDAHGGNWGYTRHGREVCFDPFAGQQDHSTEAVLPIGTMPPKHRSVRHAGPTMGRWARG